MVGSSHSTTSSSSDLSKPSLQNEQPPAVAATDFNDKDRAEKDVIEQEDAERAASLDRELSRIDTSDFPSAFPLAMITIALMLSIFLCALGKSQYMMTFRLIG